MLANPRIVVILLTALCAATSTAHADTCDKQAAGEVGAPEVAVDVDLEVVDGKRVHVVRTEIDVCGPIPAPGVVYVVQPRTINYEWETLEQDFLALILAAVAKGPF